MQSRAQLIGAKLEINSEPNDGTEIRIELSVGRRRLPPPMYSKHSSCSQRTLLIADDHAIIRSGLESYLSSHSDWRVCATCANSKETLDFLSTCPQNALPEIIIFDIQLSGEMSFDLIKTVSNTYPAVKSIAFTMFDTTGFILAAKECGVKGYVSKTQSETELLEALEKVANGSPFTKAETVFPFSSSRMFITSPYLYGHNFIFPVGFLAS